MTSNRFMAIAVPVATAAALLALLLPGGAGARYAQVMHPVALIAGGLLAFWVANYYRGRMRDAFLLIGGFLVLQSLLATEWVMNGAGVFFASNFLRALVVYQIVLYTQLLAASVLVVRMMDVRRLSTAGWTVAVAGLVLGGIFVANALPEVRELLALSAEGGALYLMIRIYDVLVMTMMLPVIWLYVQNAKARYQENATFTLVLAGIVFSLVVGYVYELVKGEPFSLIAAEYQTGSVLDGLYLFGYLVVAIGLFAHRRHQEWSFNRLNGVLA